MIFRGVPEAVFSSPAKLAVLRALSAASNPEMSGREVARRANISPPWAIRTLEFFEGLGLARRRSVRRTDYWRLNPQHALVAEIRGVFATDDRVWQQLVGELNPLVKDRAVQAAVLFGSVARGDADAESDIDLLLVVTDRHAKTRLRHASFDVGLSVLRRFGNPLQTLLYTDSEWSRVGNRGFAPRARKEGIVLRGGQEWRRTAGPQRRPRAPNKSSSRRRESSRA